MLAQWLGALPEVSVADDGSSRCVHDSDAAPDCDFGDRWARRAPHVPRRGCGPREAAGPGEGPGDGPADPGHGAARRRRRPRRGRSAAPPRSPARGRWRWRNWSARGCPTPGWCCSSTSPRSCRGTVATSRSTAKSAIDVLSGALASVDCVDGCARVRRRRRRARARGRARGARRRGATTISSSTPSRWHASSTATVGLLGARCRPTDRWANRPTRTGAHSRACGAT